MDDLGKKILRNLHVMILRSTSTEDPELIQKLEIAEQIEGKING